MSELLKELQERRSALTKEVIKTNQEYLDSVCAQERIILNKLLLMVERDMIDADIKYQEADEAVNGAIEAGIISDAAIEELNIFNGQCREAFYRAYDKFKSLKEIMAKYTSKGIVEFDDSYNGN